MIRKVMGLALPVVAFLVGAGAGDFLKGDDDAGAHQPGRIHRLDEVIGHRLVDVGDTGDVHDDDLGAMGPDAA